MIWPHSLLPFFLLLLFLQIVHPLSSTCKPQENGHSAHFIDDPSDRQAFLSCKPFGSSPSIGFWERHFCPNDMHFEYSSQQCTANSLPPNMVREANDILQIAILNGTCARGEQCIGGTVCDPLYQRCLCPYGTVAVLETLSCVKIYPMSQQQSINSPQQFWRAQVRPSSPYGTSYPLSQTTPVPPGSSCERGEQCGGGSICMRSSVGAAICVCPAHSENQNGQCIQMATKSNGGSEQTAKEMIGQGGFFKVPLGEQCNEYLGLFCADQSAICANGRCQCVQPMLEKDGRCQMPTGAKEAGPGEPCNGGQICIRGSVCNRRIPICVCPEGRDLHGGWCVEGMAKSGSSISPIMIPIGSAENGGMPEMTTKIRQRQKEAQVGEKCSLNADCAAGAYCNGNTQPPTCQCLSTHVNVNQRCEKVIYPGQRGCETDLQCSAGYAGARCVNGGQCVCPPGSTPIDQTCIPAIAWPGEACNISRLMPVCSADSYCFEGRCICNPPLSLFQKQCIRRTEEESFQKDRRECGQHLDCPRGMHCTAQGHCEFCGKEQTRLAGNCVHLEDFGGKFSGGAEFLQNDEEMRKNETEKKKMEKKKEKMNGIQQIFSALSMLRKAALDGLITRKAKNPKIDGGNSSSFGRIREKREAAVKIEEKKKEMGKRVELPHGHRMEGEPCAPGDICLHGTVCEEGQCKRPNGKICLCPPNQIIVANGKHCEKKRNEKIGQKNEEKNKLLLGDDPEMDERGGGEGGGALVRLVTARPGQRCSHGEACTGGSVCRFGRCACVPGEYLPEGSHYCVKKGAETASKLLDRLAAPGPGQLCTKGGALCMGGSKCLHGICQCPEGHNLFRGECLPPRAKMSPEKFRAQSRLFSPDFAVMDSPQPGTQPPPPIGDENMQDPVPNRIVAPGAMCRLSLECPYRTTCLKGVCRCQKGETIVNGVCRKTIHEVLPGGRCDTQKGLDCVGESHCFYGICVCLYGLVIVGHECANADVLKRVPPGGECAQGQQCQGRARCIRGKCQCQRGHRIDSNGEKRCIKSTPPPPAPKPESMPAHSEADAPAATSFIPLQPIPKFIYTIPAALAAAAEDGKFNQILTANQMSFFVDQEMLRSLLAPLVQAGKIAAKNPSALEGAKGCEGSTCLVTSPPIPSIPSSTPSPQLAAQPLSTTENPSHGIPGHSCTSNHICHGGALCLGGICVCRPGFRPLDGFCQVAKVGLGEPCFINEQCNSHGFCIDGTCRCSDNPNPPPAQTRDGRLAFHRHRCPIRPVAAAGEDCTRAQNCAWNSVCGPFSGVCECAVGLEKNQGACIAARRPRGVECLSSSNCHKHGFCDNGYCICKSGHQPVGGFCLPPARPVVDDPKAYVDPDLMAILLRKQGIEQTTNNGKMESVNSAFGLRMAKLGATSGQKTFGGEFGGNNVPWQNDQQMSGRRENALEEAAIGLGWPFSKGNAPSSHFGPQNDGIIEGGLSNEPPEMMIGFSPPEEGGGTMKAKGAKTMSLEEKREFLMRTSAGKGRGGGKVRMPGQRKEGIAMPGEFCGNNARICLGNSFCLAGWCQCPDGIHVEKGGMCAMGPEKGAANKTTETPPPMPNGPSHSPMKFHGRQPHKPWESCANGPCVHGAVCIRSSALNTVQKLGPFCQCAPGSIFIDGECVPRKPEMRILPIGSHCPQPAICDFGAICGPKGICQCPEGQKPIAGICVQIALPGETCAHGEFCADGAVCAPGLDACVCPVGWKVRQGKCHRGRKMMAKLAQREKKRKRQKVIREEEEGEEERRIMFTEMPPNSMEMTTTMPAPTFTTTKSTMPMPRILVPLGEICHSDKDCQGVPKAYCAFPTRRCTCVPGYAQLYSSICVPEERIRFPGEECVASAHFCSANSWCKDGQCQCFQRDMLALNGRCQRIHLPDEKAAFRIIRRHPQKIAEKWCHSELDCPQGAECREGECLCNGLSLAQALATNEAKSWAEQRCTVDLDCPPILGCQQGRCVCIRISLEKPLPSSTQLKKELEEGRKEENSEKEIEMEDYALGEPVGPILPGTFCDVFFRCGPGAECFFGKCQCIFRGQKLAFVNGRTECVDQKELEGEKVDSTPEFALNEDGRNLNEIANECQNGKTLEECKRGKRQIGGEDRPKPSNNCTEGKCQHSTATNLAKGPFQSEPSNGATPGNVQNVPMQTTPISQKLANPGKQCGPLDICTGGSFCVEGICLCPAGTRPSPLGGDCETFEQRKMEEGKEAEIKDMKRSKMEMANSNQPVPIKSNQSSPSPLPPAPLILPPSPSIPPPNSFFPSSTPNPQLIANQPNFSATNVDPPSTSTLSTPLPNCSHKSTAKECPHNSISLLRNLTNVKGPRRAPQRRPYSRPSENCANGEICTGGSFCQRQTKVCECPARKPLLRNHICIQSEEQSKNISKPGEKCNSEIICTENSICSDGICQCKDGFILEGTKCMKKENGEAERKGTDQRSAGMVPPPVEALPPVKLVAESETAQRDNEQGEANHEGESDSDSSTQTRSSRPRISGPPLRKISSSASSSNANRPLAPEGSSGVCPPGNVPTTDPSTGQLLVCNGMTPNCPPKSYCFITENPIFSLPGESCLNGQICLGGALCDWADRKCICAAGHLILNGYCTRKEAIEGHRREMGDFVPEEQEIGGGTKRSMVRNKWMEGPRTRAEPCPLPEHPEKCQLPDCFCSKDGRSSPAGFHPRQTPQFVVLTFDDAINERTMRDYFALFGTNKFRNPNGCPIKATFFVSHEWTDYSEVERIANSGHEIASNSITHECLREADGRRWMEEMDGQRKILSAFGNVQFEKIVGIRAPQLNLGGERQFQAMAASNFLYDNSLSIDPTNGAPFWPQTLDFRLAWPCDEESNCPESSFPSIWEIPLNQFHSLGGPQRSAMLRGAIQANASVEAIQMLLQRHFDRSFSSNRAPLVLTLNADFLQIGGDHGIQALIGFINDIMDQRHFGEVYFVTLRALIEWIRRPLPLSEMGKFPWIQCSEEDKNERNLNDISCEQPNKCIYTTPGLASPEHQMNSCAPCPMLFPWISNPFGTLMK